MAQGSTIEAFERIGMNMGDVQSVFDDKYPATKKLGWGPMQRREFGYFSPDDHYEAIVNKLLTPRSIWVDVGCGRDIFPSNVALASTLAARCAQVIGIDPDPNVEDNPFLTQRHQGPVDDYVVETKADLITMRMVAEHIARPEVVCRKIADMLVDGGKFVMLTPHKWSPVSILARAIPFQIHHVFKRFFWGTEERDTFPVEFKMNSRKQLLSLAEHNGLSLLSYGLYADCSVFSRFRYLNRLELYAWNACDRLAVTYPESCIIAVLEKPKSKRS